jgi:hypothetical protein
VSDLKYEYDESSTQWAILYSKLAIVEFCGWIEQTFDKVLFEYAENKVCENYSLYIKEVIKKHHGFNYNDHIRKMILEVVGINNLENLEDFLSYTNDLDTLKSILNTLTKIRNMATHTYTSHGATPNYHSPSVILSNIKKITPIMQKIETEIMKY